MGRPREFNEDAVIAQAMDVFWRKGYLATSVADLVDATGLQRGSLYGAFGDKHALFLASLDAYTAMALGRFTLLAAESDDPVDAVRGFVRMGAEDQTKRNLIERGCMIGNTCTELAATDPAARRRVAKFVDAMREAMADALREGQRLGTFDKDRDADAVATFVQCSMQGLTILAKAKPSAAAIEAVADEILRALD